MTGEKFDSGAGLRLAAESAGPVENLSPSSFPEL
jgi:hypothetical protein